MAIAVFAVETGVMELSTELGVCEYEVTQVDTNPAKFYYNQPGEKPYPFLSYVNDNG